MARNRSRLAVPFVLPVLVAAGLASTCLPRPARGQPIPRVEMISVTTDGGPGTHFSGSDSQFPPRTRISADGRRVVFESYAPLVCFDLDASRQDVLVRDRRLGRTILASPAWDGDEANNSAYDGVISADGRYVAFAGVASNLVPVDENGFTDIFLRDLEAETTSLVSVTSSGEQANSPSYGTAISGDGRYVAFSSGASNLIPGGGRGSLHVFVRDTVAGVTEIVSVTPEGQPGFSGARDPSISADGRYVAFLSSDRLDAARANNNEEVFIRDRQEETTRLVSLTARNTLANNGVRYASLSADGRFVAFQSNATNIVIPDTNGVTYDIFLRDVEAETTTLVSVATGGEQGNGDSWVPTVSAGGRYVAFHSWANNLVPGDTNTLPVNDIFVRDTVLETTTRVNLTPSGGEADGDSHSASISADGNLVSFESTASNLAPDHPNGFDDVFVAGTAYPEAAPGPSFEIELAAPGAPEDGGPATITVRRTGALCTAATVRYATADGTATAGEDYTQAAGTLNFGPLVASRTFQVAILDDAANEPDETIEIALSNPTGGPVLGERSTAALAVLDDDTPATLPPAIDSVTPSPITADGGTELTFSGRNFVPGLTPRLDGDVLAGGLFIDSVTYRGFAPVLPPGHYAADLVDGRGEIVASLPRAVEVISALPPGPPPPVVTDTGYAWKKARFRWTNPVAYDRIQIQDRAGTFVRQLGGLETTLEVPATRAGVEVIIQGFVDGFASHATCAFAVPADCDLPDPLGGFANPGKFSFPLYGGNPPLNPARCAAPADGGGGALLVDLALEWGGVNGFVQIPGSLGFSVPARQLYDPDLFRVRKYENRVVTGFTLEEDADRLQIEGHFQKLTEGSGLTLQGRLIHIFPADGFEDAFTFPDSMPGDQKRWHQLLYYRADRDVGEVGAKPCQPAMKIPRGDYLLQIYAVNGAGDQVHYSFSDDDRDRELLIPGAPCPPYPLVRVRDMTGKRTLPDIHLITGKVVGANRVEFRALGRWFEGDDRDGFSIDPRDPTYRCHNYEFWWHVEGVPGMPRSTGQSNVLVTDVPTLGCYWVNLEVRDRACERSVSRRHQVLAEPQTFSCPGRFYSAIQPVPDLKGIFAMAGLNPAPGGGRMTKPRPFQTRVLVVPKNLCGQEPHKAVAAQAGDPDKPPAEDLDQDLEFRLVWFTTFGFLHEAMPSKYIQVKDLCASVKGPELRYFEITIDDLGQAVNLPGPLAENGRTAPVFLQARARNYRVRNAAGGIDVIKLGDTDAWHNVGSPFEMTNRPRALEHCHWTGSISPLDQAYRFVTHAAEGYTHHFALPKSNEIPLPIGDSFIPSYENDLTSGFNSTFAYVNGLWEQGNALVDNAGDIMANKIASATAEVEGFMSELEEDTSFEWCKDLEIFNNVTEQTLFNAVIFSGLIGPVPLTVTAKVSLALRVALNAHASTSISLFSGLEGGHFVEADLYLEGLLGLELPAAVRADILFGVVSYQFEIIPKVNSKLCGHLGTRDLVPEKELTLNLTLGIASRIKVCFFSFLESLLGDIACIPSPTINILPETPLVTAQIGGECKVETCSGGGGGLLAPAVDAGEGGGGTEDFTFEVSYYYPAVKSSPDGRTEIEVLYESNVFRRPDTVIRTRENGVLRDLHRQETSDLEPAIGFLANDQALIAWTRHRPEVAGLPAKPENQYSLAELNLLRAQDEIVVLPLRSVNSLWSLSPVVIVSDTDAEFPDPADRRVDGRAAIAGDPTRRRGLVAWVRIEDPDFLITDGTVRPHLERSAIHVRPVDLSGPIGPARAISPAGINIEPTIAFSPSGNQAYCVWVHDPVHVDLVRSNHGRNLVYSVHDPASGSWTAPRAIVPNPDADYPGLLEPSIALKADGTGVLAFTALPAGAEENDTGVLAANRLVYISRLVDGVFGPPVLVHGKCQKRVYGSQVRVEIPPESQDPLSRVLKKPDIYAFWQRAGAPGTPESTGGLMASVLDTVASEPSPAVFVGTEGFTRSNVTAAVSASGIRALSVNQGLSFRGLSRGAGGGGGVPSEPAYESVETPHLPDLGIASCVLSNQFPGPGALIAAKVQVENVSFVASPVDEGGASTVGLRAIYIAEGGTESVAAELPVPVITAGGTAELEFTLEQPLDPVQLRVELNPNPFDSNALNNSRSCAFGAPAPRGFACLPVVVAGAPAVRLAWENTANYDEVLLYRDGAQLAAIPGSATVYVDTFLEPGLHTWEIRGRVGVSKSCRVATECPVPPPPPPPESFRRGDADATGRLNISDAIGLLGFLFLGGDSPACPDAADADDGGTLNITDAIRILGFLFLGDDEPPAPGPVSCGGDPTADALSCPASCP
jgi:Tol biopolymer transport system component